MRDIQKIVGEMTLEEKCSMLSGESFWYTQAIERLDIQGMMLTDGPHGLRKQGEEADHLGLNASVLATCFPNLCAVGSSWNRELTSNMASALAEECLAENVSVVLGPGLNIKRSPLCGRNFEYLSEDPYLSTQMGKHYIQGCQEKGVGTSVKHFVANNQETRRLTLDVQVEERALREIYLASFETAIKEAKPFTVMSAYNKINGEFGAENKKLLRAVLRDEWGYEGVVVTDWGGTNDRVKGLEVGMDLEMPSSGGVNDRKVLKAIQEGEIDEKFLDESVLRILELLEKTENTREKKHTFNRETSEKMAFDMACESIVLLKNEREVLPLKKEEKILVIGRFAETPRFQGGGSSYINPLFMTNALEEMRKLAPENIEYEVGFELLDEEFDETQAIQICKRAERVDKVIVFAGLSERYETEGSDRKHIDLANIQNELIAMLTKHNSQVVVVLNNGSPVAMPWVDKVQGIIESYLLGGAGGRAQAAILYGEENPSGKLAETFPKRLEDTPCYMDFPGEAYSVRYNEGIFVGYRYYDTKKIEPLFPFGHGLSYTQFEYSNISVDKECCTDMEEVEVTVEVKNIGTVKGKEVVQLYIHDRQTDIIRPYKELKGFTKVELEVGETKTIKFTLDKRSFAYYDTNNATWRVQSGIFDILIGKSSKEIVQTCSIDVISTFIEKMIFHNNSTFHEVVSYKPTNELGMEWIEYFKKKSGIDFDLGDREEDFAFKAICDFPLKTLVTFTKGEFSGDELEKLIETFNKVSMSYGEINHEK